MLQLWEEEEEAEGYIESENGSDVTTDDDGNKRGQDQESSEETDGIQPRQVLM